MAIKKLRAMFGCIALILMLSVIPITLVQAQTTSSGITLEISQQTADVVAGDRVTFETIVHNSDLAASPALIANLNIVGTQEGVEADPEDWADIRIVYLEPLAPNETLVLPWETHALTDGEYAVFVTIVSAENGDLSTASAPLIITVQPDTILPLNQVLPIVIAVPIIPLFLFIAGISYTLRQRKASQPDITMDGGAVSA